MGRRKMKAKGVISMGTTYDFREGRMIATDGSYWKFKTKEAAEAWFDGPGQQEIPLGFLSGDDGSVEVVRPDDGDGEHWEVRLV